MINIYDILQTKLSEPEPFNAQIYARALLNYRNPNRFYYDLDIINDPLYKFRTVVINILQEQKNVEIVLLGCRLDHAHFCDVFVSIDNRLIDEVSVDSSISFDPIDQFINKHIDYNFPYVIC